MLKFKFENYDGFKNLFGARVCNNGEIAHKNKLLLAFYKCAWILKDQNLYSITDMGELERILMSYIRNSWTIGGSVNYLYLMGVRYVSSTYWTDGQNGICVDGSLEFVRVHKFEENNCGVRDKIVKVKAGKLMRSIIKENEFGSKLPDEIVNYLCEVWTMAWKAYAAEQVPDVELHIDKDFKRIYSRNYCPGNFGSCMADANQHSFYSDSCDSSAAYITDKDNNVLARAILFNKVYDQDDKEYRLLERQYSKDGDQVLMQLLVNKLIAAGKIDGYKKIGAGCRDSKLFVDNRGNSLSDRRFRTVCTLDDGDTLSYQDSFKWYDYGENMMYNYEVNSWCDDLSDTDSTYYHGGNENRNWDEYNDEWTDYGVVTVYYDGREITCSENSLYNFYWIDRYDMYFHDEYIRCCSDCGDPVLVDCPDYDDTGYYSELTEEWYCCERCLERAEQSYKEDNWYLCEDTGEYEEEAYFSELLECYYSTTDARNEAEHEYKVKNYDWCVDTQSFEDPDTTFYSEVTKNFYSTEEAMIEAEVAHNREHAA